MCDDFLDGTFGIAILKISVWEVLTYWKTIGVHSIYLWLKTMFSIWNSVRTLSTKFSLSTVIVLH